MSIGFLIAILPRKAEIESLYDNGCPVPLIDVQHEKLTSCARGKVTGEGTTALEVALGDLGMGDSVLLDYEQTLEDFDKLSFASYNQSMAANHMWGSFVNGNTYDPKDDVLILARF
ncbi:hypothetical protein pEaSNUABM54_00237 [Erwinia phage pEa_SNUABM_54]|nr:hypothetical protein pEaSNUABM54_00237 [Erwinia phage pEa_SNUABM_54]